MPRSPRPSRRSWRRSSASDGSPAGVVALDGRATRVASASRSS
jgi:hypothetical protein